MNRTEAREKIVETAARLLQEHGAAAVTVRAVAQAAGLQAPALYRFFEDKDALLDAVAEHVFTTYVAEKSGTAGTGDPVTDLRTGWDAHIGFGLANAALFGLLVVPGRVSPAAEAGLAVLRGRIRRVAEAGRLRVPEPRAVDLVHAAGTGTVLALLAAPPTGRDPGLADAMWEAVAHRILTDVPTPDAAPAPLTDAERALLAEWLSRPRQ
ncbi:TetR/AcrR family transcriptional regulator [Amycolatopsis sp. FBCC-B4732]|uniref:TetR/AcrR family transcriptional regulator n=1 Tax=Amycolatopsis sp. FBCC-B4732 TaxID=3079339 RepID=UPI001FF1E145|nr:TetR/AcrR family transcriptional regulator [Amycolatopsis sp. FBCC-B4732]UOX92057.1 TetR/AcrR family transcriptional regulator [Amycolatopsis sp. FBCC-B4732]